MHLVDPEAVQAWLEAGRNCEALTALVASLPDLLAEAAEEAHRLAPDKRGSAWTLCANWQLVVSAVHDRLTDAGMEVAEAQVPESIERLRKLVTR